jgi:hypothetical protein
MRGAIDLYVTEHQGLNPTLAEFESQMTEYSDLNGNTAAAKGGAFIYGPYLRAVPPLPVGAQRGLTALKVPPADGSAGFGWVYDAGPGTIVANTAAGETDDAGTPYNTY